MPLDRAFSTFDRRLSGSGRSFDNEFESQLRSLMSAAASDEASRVGANSSAHAGRPQPMSFGEGFGSSLTTGILIGDAMRGKKGPKGEEPKEKPKEGEKRKTPKSGKKSKNPLVGGAARFFADEAPETEADPEASRGPAKSTFGASNNFFDKLMSGIKSFKFDFK